MDFFGGPQDLTSFSLPFYLRYRWEEKFFYMSLNRRKRDCPFEQSLKRKRETKIVLDKSKLILNVECAHAEIYGCRTQFFLNTE